MEHEREKGDVLKGKRRGIELWTWAQYHYEDNKAGEKKRGERELSTGAEYVQVVGHFSHRVSQPRQDPCYCCAKFPFCSMLIPALVMRRAPIYISQ
jgi:hypothetical protein